MATGLLALLDDVAALTKATAATLDDVSAQVAKTTGKVSGIVIDDAAVTPKYVVGLSPARELAIIWNITKKSLFNKLVLLAPLALFLGWQLPWIITPLLMIGGMYLCFEGYEKVHTIFSGHGEAAKDDPATKNITPEELEKIRTASAVRTDFILSAEIIAITYSTVADLAFSTQVLVLAIIGFGITVVVYGSVALIVKADDFGIWLVNTGRTEATKTLGRFIVKSMPVILKILSWIGTAAMLWVGAGIIAHGIPFLNDQLYALHKLLMETPPLGTLAEIVILMIGGLVLGFLLAVIVMPVSRFLSNRKKSEVKP